MEILGVDIGGSGIKGAVVDTQTGQFVQPRYRIPTPEGARPDDVAEAMKDMAEHFEWTGPIGCGFPAIVRNGVAFSAANIHETWIGVDVNQLFTASTGCSVYTLNDADAAGIAEMNFGVGRVYSSGVILLLTLGTGIGSALFVDGHLVPNTELGHIEVKGKDAEKRASAAVKTIKDLSWKKWSSRLQEVLSRLELYLSPDVIIIGGGVSKRSEDFFPLLTTRAKLIRAELENEAGIVGAAYFGEQQYNISKS